MRRKNPHGRWSPHSRIDGHSGDNLLYGRVRSIPLSGRGATRRNGPAHRTGFVLGGTGWFGDRGGVAARAFFLPGRGLNVGNPRAFDAGLRYRSFFRGFAQAVEMDFGMSLAAMKPRSQARRSRPGSEEKDRDNGSII